MKELRSHCLVLVWNQSLSYQQSHLTCQQALNKDRINTYCINPVENGVHLPIAQLLQKNWLLV